MEPLLSLHPQLHPLTPTLHTVGAGHKVGWAFGLGLERLAMRLFSIPDIRLFWSEDVDFLRQFITEDINADIVYKVSATLMYNKYFGAGETYEYLYLEDRKHIYLLKV